MHGMSAGKAAFPANILPEGGMEGWRQAVRGGGREEGREAGR